MDLYQSPEFLDLYTAYTGSMDGIGAGLTRAAMKTLDAAPLLVATASDFALYRGSGADPEVLPFRLSTRGFRELAAISHLGPAVASLVTIGRVYGDGAWREGAKRLRARLAATRAANSEALWRDRIAVEAYEGREAAIAAMCDYACAVTDRLLIAFLEDEARLDADFVREAYLEAKTYALGAIPFNTVMIATFFLVGMDLSFRAIRWLDSHQLDWEQAMVLIVGKAGRPTSGVTWTSNSIAQVILAASGRRLPLDRLYIAPHAETFVSLGPDDVESAREKEVTFRQLWAFTRAISELAPSMYAGYPGFSARDDRGPPITEDTLHLGEMPIISGPDDMLAMTTRLRMVLEDPRQLLSGAVTDYAAEQLRANGNDFSKVIVPGLDNCDYQAAI